MTAMLKWFGRLRCVESRANRGGDGGGSNVNMRIEPLLVKKKKKKKKKILMAVVVWVSPVMC